MDPAPQRSRTLVGRFFWATAGLALVALATLGIVLPGLPTTPFLLLAAACFARGSERLERWLLSSPTFGPLIRDFRTHRCVPRRIKAFALTMMWLFVTYALTLGMPAHLVVPRIVVGAAAVVGTIYLLSLPSEPRPVDAPEPPEA